MKKKEFQMKYLLLSIVGLMTTSCAFLNVSMAHTEGTASDVIDDTATNTPDVTSSLEFPLE
jgi:hypothetical protein